MGLRGMRLQGNGKNYIRKSLGIFTPYPIEKNEVGGACGTYGGGERCAQGSSGETRGKGAIGETQTLDGRIILRWIFRKWEGVETGWSWLRIRTGGWHL